MNVARMVPASALGPFPRSQLRARPQVHALGLALQVELHRRVHQAHRNWGWEDPLAESVLQWARSGQRDFQFAHTKDVFSSVATSIERPATA